ncbi:uncharacterized protein CLUP02_00868 [Colletotrichum lupini]|uniref:Uncharacterized protein n=1 Tax=Colletotrichum lupini TaxID=145971 RepID=A0A9Q8SBM1_9PEZI|nr:uncharacterized protein CLUP02_00868 [Colletotrichum lupini]UQC74220.1 hypothetical protein CLUP02_00868 [Colletotrichum lupini]
MQDNSCVTPKNCSRTIKEVMNDWILAAVSSEGAARVSRTNCDARVTSLPSSHHQDCGTIRVTPNPEPLSPKAYNKSYQLDDNGSKTMHEKESHNAKLPAYQVPINKASQTETSLFTARSPVPHKKRNARPLAAVAPRNFCEVSAVRSVAEPSPPRKTPSLPPHPLELSSNQARTAVSVLSDTISFPPSVSRVLDPLEFASPKYLLPIPQKDLEACKRALSPHLLDGLQETLSKAVSANCILTVPMALTFYLSMVLTTYSLLASFWISDCSYEQANEELHPLLLACLQLTTP